MTEWLGHRDLCSIQWSEWCDCGDIEIIPEVARKYEFNGDEVEEVWMDKP